MFCNKKVKLPKKVSYGELAKYLNLAIDEFEKANGESVCGFSFEDLIDFLENKSSVEINK